MKFLAIDGALRNFGLATGHFDGKNLTFQSLKLLHTKPAKARTKSLDDYRCIKEILAGLKPLTNVDIIFAEIYTGSISGRGAVSLVSAMAIIASLNKPTILVTPHQVKAITGNKKATKHEMIQWAYKRHPDLNWLKRNGKLLQINDHAADSIAVAYACAEQYKKFGSKAIM